MGFCGGKGSHTHRLSGSTEIIRRALGDKLCAGRGSDAGVLVRLVVCHVLLFQKVPREVCQVVAEKKKRGEGIYPQIMLLINLDERFHQAILDDVRGSLH